MDKTLLSTQTTFLSDPFPSILDNRILSSLSKSLQFTHPTLVQQQCIPLILQGKDVLAKARTGSGKTAAYAIPAVQKVLNLKSNLGVDASPAIRVVIMVPTRELALQVCKFLELVTESCEGEVKYYNAVTPAGKGTGSGRVNLDDIPDILVTTPSKCLALLQGKQVSLSQLSLLIIDEADLVLSYGHSADLQQILDPSQNWIPRVGVQGVLMSATMTNDVQTLKGWVLRNPAILTLCEPAAASLLTQYYTRTNEVDKFLLLYVLLKLKLIKGKALIFVNTVERGYRLRLYLEQFGIKACVLNAELPLNSRYHIVEEFNKGVYDYIIATDEADSTLPEMEDEEASGDGVIKDEDDDEAAVGKADARESPSAPSKSSQASGKRKAAVDSKPSKRPRREDKMYGVSRGIDFVAVACVINFDLPTTASAYMHRVGRTARAGQSGLSLTFIVERASWGKDKNVTLETAGRDEDAFKKIQERVKEDMDSEIQEWNFGGRKNEIEGFRYRMEDALKAVTTKRVAEARREELRRELLNSEKLKAHFAANPLDLSYLRHDAPLHPARVQGEMKHVPQYLMPKIAKTALDAEVEGMHVPFSNVRGRGGHRGGRRGRGGHSNQKRTNPLKKF